MAEEKEKTEKETVGKEAKIEAHSTGAKPILIAVAILVVVGGLFAIGRAMSMRRVGRQKEAARVEQIPADCPFHSRDGGSSADAIGRTSGEISKINGDQLTVKTSNGDLMVNIVTDTSITNSNGIASKNDLKVGDTIMVRGSSKSDGTLTATAINDRS